MDFRFTTDYPTSRIDEIVSYIAGPRLWVPRSDYPDFDDWASRVDRELRKDLKRAVIATSYHDIVGVIIYQRHKKDRQAVEIRNITVRPDVRGRYLASFLLRNTEIEAIREFQPRRIIVDSKRDNLGIKIFLRKHHYRISGHADLYGIGAGIDTIYTKELPSSEFSW